MPLRKFNVPDEVILIYYDPDDESNSVVLRYFADDIPDWIADIQIPVRDEQLVNERRKGKRFREIILPEAPRTTRT